MDASTRRRALSILGYRWPQDLAPRVLIVGVVVILLGLIGRILTYPLQADEQFYLPAAILLRNYQLYPDIGFTHMPNLPLLLATWYGLIGADNYLLWGRLLIGVSWIATLAILVQEGRNQGAGKTAIIAAIAMLVFNSDLLGPAGMAATNNFVPVPFALAAIVCFLSATRGDTRTVLLAAASGFLMSLAAGFKANFVPFAACIGFAAFLVPPSWQLRERVTRLVLPMLVGGMIGALPILYYLWDDPPGFIAHVFYANTGPQIAYWLANADPANPKIIGMGSKLIFARQLWLGGTMMLMLMVITILILLTLKQGGGWREARRIAGWQAALLASLIAVAVAVSFVPTPAHAQYYTLPVPMCALLLLILHGRLAPPGREAARPVLVAAILLAFANGAVAILPNVPKVLQPSMWASTRVQSESRQLAAAVGPVNESSPIATLEPLQVLQADLPIYPELGLGQFIYRAADWFPDEQRKYYRHLASPRTISTILERRPPGAVLVGRHEKLDAPLESFARTKGYGEIKLIGRPGEPKPLTLFLAPASTSQP